MGPIDYVEYLKILVFNLGMGIVFILLALGLIEYFLFERKRKAWRNLFMALWVAFLISFWR